MTVETTQQLEVPQDISIFKTHLTLKKEKKDVAKGVEKGNLFYISAWVFKDIGKSLKCKEV